MTTTVHPTRSRPATSRLFTLYGYPLWVLCGQLGLFVSIFIGYGAYDPFPDKLEVLLVLMFTTGVVLFGPAGHISRAIISLPIVAIAAWWLFSYMWTFNKFGWQRETQIQIPYIVAMVTMMALLPRSAIEKAILNSCYAVIGWTVLYIVTHPGAATINPDGVAGWRGNFIHKNGMAPFMLLAMIVISSFERRKGPRNASFAVAIFLIIMSQSTTTLAAGLLLLPLGIVLNRLSKSDARTSRTLILGTSAGLIVSSYVILLYLPVLLASRGKDPTLSSRTLIWARVIRAAKKRPFTGYGVGGAWINQGAEPTLSMLRGLGFTVFHSHNGFLEMWLILGFIGVGLYLILFFSVIVGGYRLLKLEPEWGRFFMLFPMLILFTSMAEVTTLGMWLTFLCGFRTLQLREAKRHHLIAS